jgi:hypothetical protein
LRRTRTDSWPQLALVLERTASGPPVALEPVPSRWIFSRPWLGSPHLARARRELDFVRDFFPELEGVGVRVGLTKRRSVLGLAALGGEPAIWIRPRRIQRFAIAHELTHLLQARGLVPPGERPCDLFALARSADYVDVRPFYLKIPAGLLARESRDRLVPHAAEFLHTVAVEAVARHPAGKRRARAYLEWFERTAEHRLTRHA